MYASVYVHGVSDGHYCPHLSRDERFDMGEDTVASEVELYGNAKDRFRPRPDVAKRVASDLGIAQGVTCVAFGDSAGHVTCQLLKDIPADLAERINRQGWTLVEREAVPGDWLDMGTPNSPPDDVLDVIANP